MDLDADLGCLSRLAERSGMVFKVNMDAQAIFKVRRLVAILLAAVLTAAAMRHIFHVYGGIAPDDMRSEALGTAIVVVVLLAVVFLRTRLRRLK
jgi:hypothetical protein